MTTSRTIGQDSVFIDITPIKRLAADLRKAAPESAKQLRTGLKAAGEIVAAEARTHAAFSKSIPGSIKVSTSGATVKVVAGGPNAPMAAAIENHGNGFVRHPVFGKGSGGTAAVWTDKNSHPAFLAPAADAKGAEVEVAVTEAVAAALASAGLEMEG